MVTYRKVRYARARQANTNNNSGPPLCDYPTYHFSYTASVHLFNDSIQALKLTHGRLCGLSNIGQRLPQIFHGLVDLLSVSKKNVPRRTADGVSASTMHYLPVGAQNTTSCEIVERGIMRQVETCQRRS